MFKSKIINLNSKQSNFYNRMEIQSFNYNLLFKATFQKYKKYSDYWQILKIETIKNDNQMSM